MSPDGERGVPAGHRRANSLFEGDDGDPGSFDVLSLTHFWGRCQKGNSVMQRTTSRSRFGRGLQRVAEWCRRRDPSALHAIEQIR
jgi:hypothetical protein